MHKIVSSVVLTALASSLALAYPAHAASSKAQAATVKEAPLRAHTGHDDVVGGAIPTLPRDRDAGHDAEAQQQRGHVVGEAHAVGAVEDPRPVSPAANGDRAIRGPEVAQQ